MKIKCRKYIAVRPYKHTVIALAIGQLFAVTAMAATDSAAEAAGDGASASGELQTVKVAGQHTPRAAARKQQENAPNLVNVLSSEDIIKLPDVNAGEALRRVPGISMSMGSGEGRFINIRGLDADLTTTTFGGVRLPPTNVSTPFGGGRAVEMGVIPAGMIGSITVTKTNKPEQDAEALGGTVEITPKALAPSQDAFLNGKIGVGIEPLRSTGVSDLSVSGGTRFGMGASPSSGLTGYSDRPFSFVGTASFYRDKRGSDDLEGSYSSKSPFSKAYSSLDQRYYSLTRHRYGIGGELSYEPDAANKWYVRYYDSGYRETINRQRLTYNFSGAPVANADGSFTDAKTTLSKSLRDEQETMSSQVFTLGGKHTLAGGARVDYDVAHTAGTDDRPFDYNSTFANPTSTAATYNNVANANYPTISTAGVNPASPAGFVLSSFNNTPLRARTTEWSGAANLALPTHLTSAPDEELKLGVSVRERTNDYHVYPYTYSAVPAVPLSQTIIGAPVTYYGNSLQNGYNVSDQAMRDLYAQGSGFVRNTAADTLNSAKQSTHNTENVFAAYVQQQVNFDKLGLLAGVRVETTKADHAGNAITGSTVTPVQTSNSYTNLFPSVQARYELAPASLLRASFSSTIARPGFNQTSAATNIDVGNNIVTTGNPNLKPTLSNNFDLSYERYLPQGGILSVGVFDKALRNYIVNRSVVQTFASSGAYTGIAPNTRVVTYGNVSSARATGLEANFEQRFTTLPGVLGGLGAAFNWTYVDSSLEIRPGEKKMLPSTSRNTYNGAVFWERDGLNLRLAANYMSRNMYSIGSNSSSDVFAESRVSADFGASYQVNKHYGVFFNAKNLTNTALKYTQGSADRVIQRETYGMTLEAGATFNF
ncbi:TonB-dependent receptor [Duganella levis]|uniref:TonB-dependent receptor n=1 Tax=Duganella levis TaxID=2692169 RepID=A0ABW9W442_9BURK|nr:TonB-dependent receptor [Duganella levis]MYN28718.1 TonB-dependent receptor [Duganella levis]